MTSILKLAQSLIESTQVCVEEVACPPRTVTVAVESAQVGGEVQNPSMDSEPLSPNATSQPVNMPVKVGKKRKQPQVAAVGVDGKHNPLIHVSPT
jgi:hypothetical protein